MVEEVLVVQAILVVRWDGHQSYRLDSRAV